jgi:hypothetical protein
MRSVLYGTMMKRRIAELDESKIDETSRILLAEFSGHPACRLASVQMEALSEGSWSLIIAIPSPTGDPRRDVAIWLDEGRIPSLEFGAWHSHADLWDTDLRAGIRKMLAYLQRIMDGEVVLAEAPTVSNGLPFRVVDLRDYDEVLDELTSPAIPPDMKLFSWSGAQDRELSALRDV